MSESINDQVLVKPVARSAGHVLAYGPSGAGKTVLAASAPLPQHIMLSDSIGNAQPYFYHEGKPCRVVGPQSSRAEKEVVVIGGKALLLPVYLCYANEDTELLTPIRRLWDFSMSSELFPGQEIQKQLFDLKLPLLPKLARELSAVGGTLIVDSLTLLTSDARAKANAIGDAGMGEMGVARVVTDEIEFLCRMLRSLPCNVILTAHIADREYEVITPKGTRKMSERTVAAPGRMARQIRAYFSDVWYCFTDAEHEHLVLTQGDDIHEAKNSFAAPVLAPNNWQAITANFQPVLWQA